MAAPKNVGVFFCHEGTGMPEGVDLAEVARYAATLPGVVHVEDRGQRPRLDPETLSWELKRKGVRTVVVAGDSPGFFKPAFTRALADAGGDPPRCGWPRSASTAPWRRLDRARQGGGRVRRLGVPYGLAAVPDADAGATRSRSSSAAAWPASRPLSRSPTPARRCTWSRRRGTIGGHMAMFDKTFPTLDCAACILTPEDGRGRASTR